LQKEETVRVNIAHKHRRDQWIARQFEWFNSLHTDIPDNNHFFADKCPALLERVRHLSEWFENKSWTTCKKCSALLFNPMLPKNQILQRSLPTCPCKAAVLKMPTCHDFPPELQSLSTDDQRVLSFFKILTGPYRRAQHGYRVKTHALHAVLKLDFIDDEIDAIPEPSRRLRLRKAFQFLMSCLDSHYSYFFDQRHMLELKDSYNFAELSKIKYIETALWPVLYYRDDFCESAISQAADTKLSHKKHFFHKCLGPIIDYSLDFALLQFQYERCCYQIITGTIESGKKFGTSSAMAMDSKPISHTYWRWQHCILLDTVERFGFPNLFVTITANEWEMPKPFWCSARTELTNLAGTSDAFAETMSIVHALQEIVNGLYAGSNHKNWRQHLLANCKHRDRRNVKAYFYRIEFQKRGTPHIHALFWIDKLHEIDLRRLSADLPQDNLKYAFLVAHLQR